MFSRRYISAGIEIGTNSIKILLAELGDDDSLSFIGGSEVPYPEGSLDKVIRGEIEDVQTVTDLLRQALTEAEERAGAKITNCHFCVTGPHFQHKIHSSVRTNGQGAQVSEDDIYYLEEELRNYSLREEWQVIHNLKRRCFINNNHEVRSLEGQYCHSYKQENLIVFGNAQQLEGTINTVNSVMGVYADSFAFSGLASAHAVMSKEDRNRNGTLSIDIGEGITEFSLFFGGNCFYTGQLPIGCRQAANDLSIALQLPFARCQQLIKDHGRAMLHFDSRETCIEIVGKNGNPHQIKRHHIETIINLRFKEIFELIKKELQDRGVLERLGNRIYLSGGGALIKDMDRLAKEVFKNVPVEIGRISNAAIDSEFDNPRFVTTAGVIIMAMEDNENWGPSSLLQQISFDLRDLIGGIRDIFVNVKNALKF